MKQHKNRQKQFKNPEKRPNKPNKPKLNIDLFGLHAVREAWHNPNRKIHVLYLTDQAMKGFETHLQTATDRPKPNVIDKKEFERALPSGSVHQGIGLSCAPLEETYLQDIIIQSKTNKHTTIIMLDQVTDPHNVGAILRSGSAFGADALILQRKHAPDLSGVLAKTACGALEHLPVIFETNLSRSIETLQKEGFIVIGLDERGNKEISQVVQNIDKIVLVLGAEGDGLRRLVREHCDILARLPTQGAIQSLNVSNAAAVSLYALTLRG